VFLRALAGIDSQKTKDNPDLLSQGTDEEILALFDNKSFHQGYLEKDSVRSVEEAWSSCSKKQRPGEPPTLEASRNFCGISALIPKRYDLTKVGRHKLNARLGLNTDLDGRTVT
jgi:DNA-directed RNA polymerase subunit beta